MGSARAKVMHPFEKNLLVPVEDLEILLRGYLPAPWDDFLLNPRRLRGSDFLMRWSQGVWSEERLVEAVNSTSEYFAMPYGPSSAAPDSVREYELYFERLEAAGLGTVKRPDLLIFSKADEAAVRGTIGTLGGVEELPFTPENHPKMRELLSLAILAIECENSLWVAQKMPSYGSQLRPMPRLGRALGLPQGAVLPTIIIKEEDIAPLRAWQNESGIPIHVWHVFYDMAFGIVFDEALKLFREGLIVPTSQTFQAPGGATTKKNIYKIYYHYAYEIGVAVEEPTLVPAVITDANGHILPYVSFRGGRLRLANGVLEVLSEAANG